MEFTSEQRQFIAHCLRVAADCFNADAKVAESSDLTSAAKASLQGVFIDQESNARDLADIFENEEE
jgi:hypothetical protein